VYCGIIKANKQGVLMAKIGYKVALTVPMLGNEAGALGYVYEEYTDLSDETKSGVSVVFENGNYDGFSYEEQKKFLKFLYVIPFYAGYKFQNVMRVSQDFDHAYWNFTL
jgi:hypothetical protein